jgi:hypothetical protein
MGYLQGTNCYLSGPIEHDRSTENWRVEPIGMLSNRFGIQVFDPNSDPKQSRTTELKEAKAKRDWQKVKEIAWGFVRKDLYKVDKSEFIIARIGYEKVYYESDINWTMETIDDGPHLRQIPTTGTIHEIINSDSLHRPTLIICELGIEYIPTWLIGFIPLQYLFGSWADLYNYLDEVDQGRHKSDNRWAIVYGIV